jgi:hypothetical protein
MGDGHGGWNSRNGMEWIFIKNDQAVTVVLLKENNHFVIELFSSQHTTSFFP